MGHYKSLLVILVALVTGSPASAAYFKDGNWLHSNCQRNLGSRESTQCQSYIIGVIDGSDAVNNALYCWPENATVGQARDIVKKWLEENPALRTMPGGDIVVSALKEAFPTKRMWRPPQRDENGRWAVVPLTNEKSTDIGEWVAACNGEYQHGFSEAILFIRGLPENYQASRTWFEELLILD